MTTAAPRPTDTQANLTQALITDRRHERSIALLTHRLSRARMVDLNACAPTASAVSTRADSAFGAARG